MATASLSDITSQIKAHEAEIARLKAAAEAQRKEEVAALVQDLRTKIAAYGISAAELGLARGKGKVRRRSTLAKAVVRWSYGQLAERLPGWADRIHGRSVNKGV